MLCARKDFWSYLKRLGHTFSHHWCLIGDLNQVAYQKDKRGGRRVKGQNVESLWYMMQHYEFLQVPFQGPRFTWIGGLCDGVKIQQRLDQCWSNTAWLTCFSDAHLKHLPITHSDHNHILLVTVSPEKKQVNGEDVKVDKLNFIELPKNSKCLMDCEAAEILQGIQDHMVVLSSDADIKIPVSFDKGLTYAKRDGGYNSFNTVQKTLEPLKKYGVSDFEICMIANIGVVSEDEIFALLPTLKDKKGKVLEALKSALGELSKLKS